MIHALAPVIPIVLAVRDALAIYRDYVLNHSHLIQELHIYVALKSFSYMLKSLKFLSLVVLLFCSGNSAFIASNNNISPGKFELQIHITAPDHGLLILLFYEGFSSVIVKRDTLNTKDSLLAFKGEINYPHLANIIFKNKYVEKISDPFFISPGKQNLIIKISYSNDHNIINNDDFKITETGNKTEFEYENQYLTFLNTVEVKSNNWYTSIDSLNKLSTQVSKTAKDSMLSLLKIIQSSEDSLTVAYIKMHPDSYVGLWMLIDYFSRRSYKPIYEIGYKNLNYIITTTPSAKKFKKALHISSLLGIGSYFPKKKFKTLENKWEELSFKNYQYTIVDFWFSSCGPCIGSFKEIKQFYKSLKLNNIQFVAISVDKTADLVNWQKIIKSEKYQWKQLLDENGLWAVKYNIRSFPSNFIIDSNGKIIDKNISSESLQMNFSLNTK